MYPDVRMPFPITCTACQKTFSIADDVYERKVKGRVVTIKCKQCQAGIRVDGTTDAPIAATSSNSARPPRVAERSRDCDRRCACRADGRSRTCSDCTGTCSDCTGTCSDCTGTCSDCTGTCSDCTGTCSDCTRTCSDCTGTCSDCTGTCSRCARAGGCSGRGRTHRAGSCGNAHARCATGSRAAGRDGEPRLAEGCARNRAESDDASCCDAQGSRAESRARSGSAESRSLLRPLREQRSVHHRR